ncbi:MAG: LexA family transcriptional regulator [Prolixibacteraceae bacterium]
MRTIANNIRFLRKRSRLTQADLADRIQIKRSLIGAYEEGRALPKITVLKQLATLFGFTIDQFIGSDFEKEGLPGGPEPVSSLRILPVVVDRDNEELIPIVPIKASAGYLNGLADPEYIGSLPRFSMPVPELASEKTFRVFQIKGESMLPILPGSYLFCEYVEAVSAIREGDIYIVITREEGLVCKRVYIQDGDRLLLKSDNPEYTPYKIDGQSVLELWKAKGILTFAFPKPEVNQISHISDVLREVKEELRKLRDSR